LGAADLLFGQSGDDTLNGDDGGDRLWGGSGDDHLFGGPGPDWLWAGGGADELSGEEGSDRLFAAADDGAPDTLDCGESGDDRDRAVLRPGDTAVDCERVRTLAH
jgi:Ca2+-binding RTX toxin-like protein